jgi:electron transport complex protein RnfB
LEPLAERIDALLPQTQCRRCGYPGCRPYAEAIGRGEAEINQCPPGGERTINRIAALLGRSPLSLNPAYGVEAPLRIARVVEKLCIGCTKCIQACPVDAIIGAAKQMHTALDDLCTGCELCLPPCPMDCIEMVPAGLGWDEERATAARERYEARNARLAREANRRARLREPAALADPERDLEARRATVQVAIARSRARRQRGEHNQYESAT